MNYLDIDPMEHIDLRHWVHNLLLDSGKDHEYHIVDLKFLWVIIYESLYMSHYI